MNEKSLIVDLADVVVLFLGLESDGDGSDGGYRNRAHFL
jgi:hypothetical protein